MLIKIKRDKNATKSIEFQRFVVGSMPIKLKQNSVQLDIFLSVAFTEYVVCNLCC